MRKDPVAWAQLFHDTYERLALQYSYETRKETRQFDPESPNGRLMVAVCRELIGPLEDRIEELETPAEDVPVKPKKTALKKK